MTDAVIYFFSSIFVVFCTLPIHEYAHALVATKLGDTTPESRGRMTLNPLAHIDPIGAVMILLVGFGYAKPVPVNARNFKNPRKGMALTALAGPASNLIMALFFVILQNVFYRMDNGSTAIYMCRYFFYWASYINVSLAVFNLIPIPPLDGSRIANLIIPRKYYFAIMKYERYIMIGVFILLFTGILSVPLEALTRLVYSFISFVGNLPFRLF